MVLKWWSRYQTYWVITNTISHRLLQTAIPYCDSKCAVYSLFSNTHLYKCTVYSLFSNTHLYKCTVYSLFSNTHLYKCTVYSLFSHSACSVLRKSKRWNSCCPQNVTHTPLYNHTIKETVKIAQDISHWALSFQSIYLLCKTALL